jgi:hypothetical protein
MVKTGEDNQKKLSICQGRIDPWPSSIFEIYQLLPMLSGSSASMLH